MRFDQLKANRLKNRKFRKEYQKWSLSFELSQMLIEARIMKGITQEMLARKMRTKQSAIARVESGKTLPSLSFLERMAEAYKTHLLPPKFGFMIDYKFEVEEKPVAAQNFFVSLMPSSTYAFIDKFSLDSIQSGIANISNKGFAVPVDQKYSYAR